MADRGGIFVSLRTRNYRLWISGQMVSLIGTWMQRVAQDWLVLDLSHGNAFLLGVVMALQFGPTLLLSAWGGVLADRYDKRRMLMVTQALMALCALSVGVLQVTGLVRIWHVMAIALAMGCVAAIEAPTRQSFTIEMVGPEHLPNAVGINSMVFNLAGIVGPAISGVLIGLIGTGCVFLLNFISFVGVGVALWRMRPAELRPSDPIPAAKGQLRQGFSYVWNRRDLFMVMLTVFVVATFGLNFSLTLAVLARETFGRGAASYGMLSTCLAFGTLLGATLAARRTKQVRMRLFFGAAVAFGISEAVVSVMPTYFAVAVALVPTGLLALTFTTAAMNIIQLSVDSQLRGRVMGIYMVAFLGGTPLGSPLVGWLADLHGGRMPLLVGGVVSVAAGLACATYLRRHPCLVVAEDISGTDDVLNGPVPPAPAATPVCEPTPLARRR
ncbi:MFS transporter [Mycobacterium sp. CBMA271]|uniref:MFS transporter n=1 Tax=unclassified Mycobacteroides TaxID=2618759 RepID=UPI0013233553|nr:MULTISPECIES: MFS transporter [unclassified Mycobacteroides]MUM15906.1 MFS transporter [Mycobacteroides sp. CBMA 326]MUM24518.1 MFS transporter [Mycobacteroides sp. CBMA 271]